jgi:hypothetical protein
MLANLLCLRMLKGTPDLPSFTRSAVDQEEVKLLLSYLLPDNALERTASHFLDVFIHMQQVLCGLEVEAIVTLWTLLLLCLQLESEVVVIKQICGFSVVDGCNMLLHYRFMVANVLLTGFALSNVCQNFMNFQEMLPKGAVGLGELITDRTFDSLLRL